MQKAFDLCKNIDEKDTIYVALTLELRGGLWTGDKKLINGLEKKKVQTNNNHHSNSPAVCLLVA